ncbi:MAG: hypothetical protein C0424_10490 [Sphingobacteriaceae bacterium]|nr:hypothetical protein [Sphingobacteriaceae bacterium]
MELNIDLFDENLASPEQNKKKELEYRKCLAAADRIRDRKVDILGSDALERDSCCHAIASLGERGRSVWHSAAGQSANYDKDTADHEFDLALQNTRKKTPSVFFKMCKAAGVDTAPENSFDAYKPTDFLPEGVAPSAYEDLETYGFFEWNNQYFKMNGSITSGFSPEPFSNFTLEVLYHIYNGVFPRRVVRIRNIRGRELVLDVQTKALTSMNAFKEFTEGSGNFLFWGGPADLMKLKSKLYEQEKSCMQVETLGWHTAGFFAFSNGIFNGQWEPVDENGVVAYQSKNYYIPSGNQSYADDAYKYANEKRFLHTPSTVNFRQWEREYTLTYGKPGYIMLLYTISCLFSDYIFKQRNNFPILFFFGEGGSGKSSMINSAQYLFGRPQDPLKISEKANTDKAKIRKMAQFVNALACLEEYTNKIPTEAKNTLRGLYDRFGYERGNLEGRFSTESVPISSGVAITGNEYPDDDPLLQRCILMDYNRNTFTQAEKEQFDRLRSLQEKGITSVTCELLGYRSLFEKNFVEVFKACGKEMHELLGGNNSITARMRENYALMCATYKIMSMAVKFTFSYDELLDYMKEIGIAQASKRESGGETQRFWDIMLYLLNDGKIKHGQEFELNGNQLLIRFTELHQQYLIAHRTMYGTVGLNASTMRDKLKNSEAYAGHIDSKRFDDKKTSAMAFHYDKVNADIARKISLNHGNNDSTDAESPNQLPF